MNGRIRSQHSVLIHAWLGRIGDSGSYRRAFLASFPTPATTTRGIGGQAREVGAGVRLLDLGACEADACPRQSHDSLMPQKPSPNGFTPEFVTLAYFEGCREGMRSDLTLVSAEGD